MLKTTINYCRLALVVMLLAVCVVSRADYNGFRRFTNTGYLRDNTTLCALRDKYGFLWVGTSTGLNCFDGNGVPVYRNSEGTLHTAETSNINILYEYGDDVWFGGSSGLYVFKRKSNTFAPLGYKTKYGVQISSMATRIVTAANGMIWICTHGQGVFVLNPADGSLLQNSRHGIFFSDMVTGRDGLVYAVDLTGSVSVFRPDGRFVYSCSLPEYVVDKNKICMVASGPDIWISSGTRLYRLNPRTRSIERKVEASVPTGINSLLAGAGGNVLLGTVDGVWQYATATGVMTRLDSPGSYSYGLTDHNVSSLSWDTDGSLIVVTQMGGISYMPWQSEAFVFTPLPASVRGGSCNFVRALCPSVDKKGVWVGTDRGLCFYTAATGELRPVALNIDKDEITSLTADGTFLWIGLRNSGLRMMDTSTGAVKSYTYDEHRPYSVISNDINDVYRTSHGEIFVLTTWGLCRFEPEQDRFMTFSNLSQQTSFVCMQEDSHGRLWAATENHGLYMRPRPDAIFEQVGMDDAGSAPVTTMCLDSRGVLWAAVQGVGVFLYNDASGAFEQLDVPQVQGKTVIFMEEDKQGYIWIGLRDVIVRVAMAGDNSPYSQLYTYNRNVDFQPIMWSSCRLTDGRVLFGSGNGFFTFEPKLMKSNDNLANVYPQSLSFPYLSNSDDALKRLGLNVLLYMQEEIRLPYSYNTFTLHLSASRYGDMPPVRYDYMMRGVDKSWIRGATSPEITYTGLGPGTYELLLSHGSGENAKVSSLRIVILPPWYRTVWAYLFYLVAVALLAWGIFLRLRRMIRAHYDKRIQEDRARKEREMLKSKIQFFVDLVHEIRTPLTLMSLPMERMSEELAAGKALPVAEGRQHIQSMQHNMNYLLGITNELLDFQKAEDNGEIKLRLLRCGVSDLLRDICRQFEHPMAVSGKELSCSLPDEDICTALDVDKVKRVLMNLMGNAMKYSRHRVEVCLKSLPDGRFTISVGDDGPGIPAKERDKIFDMYYQIDQDHMPSSLGTGLGLAYAKLLATAHGGDLTVSDNEGGGALFTLTLAMYEGKLDKMPAEAVSNLSDEPDSDACIPLPEGGVKRSFCVLLVEDNEDLLRVTAESLGKWYKVKKARDGVDALEAMRLHDIDLIITDVMMPRMDGMELCRRVKEDINYSHIPVIMLTAKTTNEAKVEGMESGADIYVEKPFSVRQLHLQIVNLLRMRYLFYERMRSVGGIEKPEQSAGELGMNRQDINFLEKMNKYMLDNISDEEFSIDTLAERLNMSRSSFYRKIKALTGMTPVDYMRNARLDHAAKLLAEGGKVTEVAMMVGFTSSSYFAKCFKAKFGVLPKDYATRKSEE